MSYIFSKVRILRTHGTALFEYAILAAFLGTTAVVTTTHLGSNVQDAFTKADTGQILKTTQINNPDASTQNQTDSENSLELGNGDSSNNTPAPDPEPTPPSDTETEEEDIVQKPWEFIINPGQEHSTGGYLPDTWITITLETAPSNATLNADSNVRILVNGLQEPLPVVVTRGDTLNIQVRTSDSYDTTTEWTITVDDVIYVIDATTRPAPDTTPDQIVFEDIVVSETTSYTTEPALIAGLENEITVKATAEGDGTPKISVNGGPFGDVATVRNNDTIRIQGITPAPGETVTITVTAGSTITTYTITTKEPAPQSAIKPFDFGSRKLAWNNSSWRITSPYVDIEGLTDVEQAFVVTGTGMPYAQSNVQGGAKASGMVRNGTTLQIDAPFPGGTHTGTLTIDGVSGSFIVTTDTIPDQTISYAGTLYLWIPMPNTAKTFSVTGGGNPGAQSNGGNTTAHTTQNGRITSGLSSNGFNLLIDAPAQGSSHTITLTLDGLASSFKLTRP